MRLCMLLKRSSAVFLHSDINIVGILKKLGIVNHFKGDIRLTEGGSESVKKFFCHFLTKIRFLNDAKRIKHKHNHRKGYLNVIV